MTTISRSVVVHGRVQGVFFRDSTTRAADKHGVAGWVRNRPDGAVEARFEGTEEAVGEMVEFCRSGPPRADVERVEVGECEPEGFESFEVRG